MRVTQSESVTRLLWVTMLVVASAILAGFPEELLEECIAQVLFLLSCAVASITIEVDFAQGSESLATRDIEWGLELRHQWSARQRCTIIICIVALDASILANNSSEVVPRLLIAGLLVLWLARYLVSAVPSRCMTATMTSLSTAILQAMLWEVGRPIATIRDTSDPLRLLFTLAATILLLLRQFDCESYVVLVIVAYEAPQFLLVGRLVLVTNLMVLIAEF
jgi:hypothetical protein